MQGSREISLRDEPASSPSASSEGMEMGLLRSNKESSGGEDEKDPVSDGDTLPPKDTKESLRSLDVRRLWELAYPEVRFDFYPAPLQSRFGLLSF
jgi:hypothetical protein